MDAKGVVPPEILLAIFKLLKGISLINCSLTCQYWNRIYSDFITDDTWEIKCRSDIDPFILDQILFKSHPAQGTIKWRNIYESFFLSDSCPSLWGVVETKNVSATKRLVQIEICGNFIIALDDDSIIFLYSLASCEMLDRYDLASTNMLCLAIINATPYIFIPSSVFTTKGMLYCKIVNDKFSKFFNLEGYLSRMPFKRVEAHKCYLILYFMDERCTILKLTEPDQGEKNEELQATILVVLSNLTYSLSDYIYLWNDLIVTFKSPQVELYSLERIVLLSPLKEVFNKVASFTIAPFGSITGLSNPLSFQCINPQKNFEIIRHDAYFSLKELDAGIENIGLHKLKYFSNMRIVCTLKRYTQFEFASIHKKVTGNEHHGPLLSNKAFDLSFYQGHLLTVHCDRGGIVWRKYKYRV